MPSTLKAKTVLHATTPPGMSKKATTRRGPMAARRPQRRGWKSMPSAKLASVQSLWPDPKRTEEP